LELRERGSPRQTPPCQNPPISSPADLPPTRERRHPQWSPWPHLSASRADLAFPSTETLAVHAMDAQHGQGSTDHPLACHLAIELS
jgi:hypothetical protein